MKALFCFLIFFSSISVFILSMIMSINHSSFYAVLAALSILLGYKGLDIVQSKMK